MRLYLRGDVYWTRLPGGRRVSTKQRDLGKAEVAATEMIGRAPPLVTYPFTKGTIYAIEAIGSGRVKIGWTRTTVERRLRDLQTGCPFPLRVLATTTGLQRDEWKIHRQLRPHLAVAGTEWFHLTPEVEAWIRVCQICT